MSSTIAVSNPGTRRTSGRRRGLNRIWSSQEWKDRKAAFLKIYPNCEMHKAVIIKGSSLIVPATVPHHPNRDSYKGHYTDLELSECVAYCARCHFALHKGMRLCRTCGEHYHPWDAHECRHCFDKTHPDIVAKREEYANARKQEQKEIKEKKNAKARAAKRQHPCRLHTVSGKCQKSAIGSQCMYSATKALKQCMDIVLKKREAELAQSIAGSVTER